MTGRWRRGKLADTIRQVLVRASGRPGLTAFLVAFTVRMALATVIAVQRGGSVFQDDVAYLYLATLWSSDGIGGLDADGQEFFRSHISFLGPIGLIFRVFGVKPIFAQSLSAIAGAVTAACVVAIVRRHTRPAVALAAGPVGSRALPPSGAAWSVDSCRAART